jgi:hypothetical protein
VLLVNFSDGIRPMSCPGIALPTPLRCLVLVSAFVTLFLAFPTSAHADPVQVSGVLRDAATGGPIQNACVLAVPVDVSAPRQSTNVNNDVNASGVWSITAEAPFYVAFYTTANGNCGDLDEAFQSAPVPSWWNGQEVVGATARTVVPPRGATAFAAGTTDVIACLGTNTLAVTCVEPTTTLSGHVVTTGPVPLANTCVLVLGPPGPPLALAISDASGRWSVANLPVNSEMVVGFLPAFGPANDPCPLNGPPPVAAAGALQPEFYPNTWINLNQDQPSPSLFDDPLAWALAHGATALRASSDRVDVCITKSPPSADPRPGCVVATPTPTPTPTPTRTPTRTSVSTTNSAAPAAATPAASSSPQLAATGASPSMAVLGGVGLLAVGLVLMLAGASRRGRAPHNRDPRH